MHQFTLPSLLRRDKANASCTPRHDAAGVTPAAPQPPAHPVAHPGVYEASTGVRTNRIFVSRLIELEKEELAASRLGTIASVCVAERASRGEVEADELEWRLELVGAFDTECVTDVKRALTAREARERRGLFDRAEQHWSQIEQVHRCALQQESERRMIAAAESVEREQIVVRRRLSAEWHALGRPAAAGNPRPSYPPQDVPSSMEALISSAPYLADVAQLGPHLLRPDVEARARDSCDAAVAQVVRWELECRRICESHYTREKASLDAVEVHPLKLASPFQYLPGAVVPWNFVEDERSQRRDVVFAEEQARCELDGLGQIFEKCILLERIQFSSLRSAYVWANHVTLPCVLLVQRWWRWLKLTPARQRRCSALRAALPQARSKARAMLTVSLLEQRIEDIEDATLRDVWAEDYETGDMGLYFPFRRQVLEIAVERHSKRIYNAFLSSLRVAVYKFIRIAHEVTAARMHRVLLVEEREQRYALCAEEDRHWAATVKLDHNHRLVTSEDPRAWDLALRPQSTFCIPMPSIAHLELRCEELYYAARHADHRRVAHCRNGWRQFRLESHRFIEEHQDQEWYLQLTATRVPSASVRTPAAPGLTPIQQRIPSAGYQRAGSAGYQRLSSAGYSRLGSAGYRRLGSASSRPLPGRQSSASQHRGSVLLNNQQAPLPLFWEGYAVVAARKTELAAAESEQRDYLEAAFAHHLHYATLYFEHVLRYPASIRNDWGSYAAGCVELLLLESSFRRTVADECTAAYQHLSVAAVSSKATAELMQAPRTSQCESEEHAARLLLLAKEREAARAVFEHIEMWVQILSTGTEHLKRIGVVPRAPGEMRRGSVRRLSSALQRDSFQSRRRNYSTVAAVAVVIQRWWRDAHFRPYRVPHAAKAVLMQRRQQLQDSEREIAAASVVQQQLKQLSDDQLLTRRMSSAGPQRGAAATQTPIQRPPSSHRSAMSNLSESTFFGDGIESLRIVMSRRMLQPDAFVSWATFSSEEAANRADWELMERLGRQRLHGINAKYVLGRLVNKRVERITTRQEPSNRLRIEHEQLHSFVALFFSPLAEVIRAAHAIEREGRERKSTLKEEALAWFTLWQHYEAGRDALRFQQQLSESVIAGSIPRHGERNEKHDASMLHLQSALQFFSRRNTRSRVATAFLSIDVSVRLQEKEELGRSALGIAERVACQRLTASALVESHACLAGELFAAWLHAIPELCADFDMQAPRCSLPIARWQCLAQDEADERQCLMSTAVDRIYTEVMISRHELYGHILFEGALHAWQRLLAPHALFLLQDVTNALVRRLGHMDRKLLDLLDVESRTRRVLEELQERERHSRGLDATVGEQTFQFFVLGRNVFATM